MKVLLYGGCHAGVIKELLLRYCDEISQCDIITNYVLIGAGMPFPYDRIHQYDAVIYSPILNKGEYNTAYLREYCLKANVLPICYPWLQWNGYHPEAKKYPHVDWLYKFWSQPKSQLSSIESFVNLDIAEEMRDYDFLKNAIVTTDHMREQEKFASSDVKIADFVIENYKNELLFLTPDHPAAVVYRELLSQIASVAGVKILEQCFSGFEQFHPEQLLPIIPYIADRININFHQTSYKCAPALGHRYFDLLDLKKIIYFSADDIYISYNVGDAFHICDAHNINLDVGLYVIHTNMNGQDVFVSGSDYLRRSIKQGESINLKTSSIVTKSISAFQI